MAVFVFHFSSAHLPLVKKLVRLKGPAPKKILLLSEMISKGLNENRSFWFRGFVSFPAISDFRSKMTSQKFFEMEEQGSGCSTAVEHTPQDREVVGSNTAGWRLFSLLHLSLYLPLSVSGVSLIRSLAEVQHYWFSWKKCMPSSAGWGKASLIRSDWAKKEKNFHQVCFVWLARRWATVVA